MTMSDTTALIRTRTTVIEGADYIDSWDDIVDGFFGDDGDGSHNETCDFIWGECHAPAKFSLLSFVK